MAGRAVLTDEQPFFAGLNTTADESKLADGEVRRAENAKLTEYGAITKCLGNQRMHASALAAAVVRGGFSWERPTSTQQLALCNGVLHTGTYAAIPMTWTAQAGAFDASAYPAFAHFRDASGEVVYIADGGLLNKWTGAALSVNLAGTPSVARVWVQNQRLFGVSGTDQVVYWSALNDGDTLGIAASLGGNATVRAFGAQAITTGMALGASTILFHRTGISRFTGWSQDDIAIATGTQGVSVDTGTIAPRSIVQVENVGMFLSVNGIYVITESGVQAISAPIEASLRAFDQTQVAQVCAVHSKATFEVLFFLPGLGVYRYNYRIGGFSPDRNGWTGPRTGVYTVSPGPLHCLWAAKDAQAKPIVLGGFADGFVRHCEKDGVYKDDVRSDSTGGTAFTMTVDLKRMYFGAPTRTKSLKRAFVTLTTRGSTTTALRWRTNSGSGLTTLPTSGGVRWNSILWNHFTWGASSVRTRRLPLGGRGPYADFAIVDDGEGESAVSRVDVHAFDLGERGE